MFRPGRTHFSGLRPGPYSYCSFVCTLLHSDLHWCDQKRVGFEAPAECGANRRRICCPTALSQRVCSAVGQLQVRHAGNNSRFCPVSRRSSVPLFSPHRRFNVQNSECCSGANDNEDCSHLLYFSDQITICLSDSWQSSLASGMRESSRLWSKVLSVEIWLGVCILVSDSDGFWGPLLLLITS